MEKRIRVFIFALIILSISLFNILKKDKTFSESENRYLQIFPKFTKEAFLSGDFNQEMEVYANDQFLGRDMWVSLNTQMDMLLGKQDNGRAYFGKEDWLFSVDQKIDTKQYNKNLETLKLFTDKYYDRYNISMLMVPTKSQIASQYLPKNAPIADEEKILQDLKDNINSNVNIIDLKTTFKNYQDEKLYYRTDHHWTSQGAYRAYQKLIGDKARDISTYKKELVSDNFYGTDYRKVNSVSISPDKIEVNKDLEPQKLSILANTTTVLDSMYDESKLEKTDQYAYFLSGDHSLLEIETEVKNNQHILIVKDSFANSLIPYLTSHYETITVVDLRYYNGGLDSLLEKGSFNEILFVYNTQTFLQDKSISGI